MKALANTLPTWFAIRLKRFKHLILRSTIGQKSGNERYVLRIRDYIIFAIAYLLMVLWFHTAFDKYEDLWKFQVELSRQPLPDWAVKPLTHAVPAVELIAGALLFLPFSHKIGYWFSSILMLAFTLYVALGLSKVLGHLPCACSKIISSLSWKQHLVFNAVFLVLALVGLSFQHREKTIRMFKWCYRKLRTWAHKLKHRILTLYQ